MTQSDADGLQQFSKFLWNSEVWRAAVNVQHRFEDGYEPSDMDSLRLDFQQLLPNPAGKVRHRQIRISLDRRQYLWTPAGASG